MHTLRNAKNLARFMLVWFALSIGVAIASPMVKPQGMQLVCSGAGAMKIVVTGEDGTAVASSHTLDCPLCAATGAPPLHSVVVGASATPVFTALPLAAQDHTHALAALPPARAPPHAS